MPSASGWRRWSTKSSRLVVAVRKPRNASVTVRIDNSRRRGSIHRSRRRGQLHGGSSWALNAVPGCKRCHLHSGPHDEWHPRIRRRALQRPRLRGLGPLRGWSQRFGRAVGERIRHCISRRQLGCEPQQHWGPARGRWERFASNRRSLRGEQPARPGALPTLRHPHFAAMHHRASRRRWHDHNLPGLSRRRPDHHDGRRQLATGARAVPGSGRLRNAALATTSTGRCLAACTRAALPPSSPCACAGSFVADGGGTTFTGNFRTAASTGGPTAAGALGSIASGTRGASAQLGVAGAFACHGASRSDRRSAP